MALRQVPRGSSEMVLKELANRVVKTVIAASGSELFRELVEKNGI